jgi:hypothetical protein
MKHAKQLFTFATIVIIGCGGTAVTEAGKDTANDGGNGATTTRPDGSTTTLPGDGGVAPATDATVGVDGSPSGGNGTITCGGETCDAATQDCCVGTGGASCGAKGSCSGGGTLSCSSSSSCTGGQKCCGGFSGQSFSASCEDSCGSGLGSVQLCESDTECASGKCQDGIGGIKYCGNGGIGGFDSGFGGFDANFGGG